MVIPSSAKATNPALGVYPPIIQVKALNGAEVVAPITIVNESETSLTLAITLRGFDPSTSKKAAPVFYPAKNTPTDVSNFLSTVQIRDNENPIKNINLYPKESKTLQLYFPVKNKDAQEYYFAAVFSSIPERQEKESTSVHISTGVSTLVFASLNERENLMPTIDTFSTDFFHSSSPIDFTLFISNTGDSFKNVSGEVSIYNMLGKKSGQIEIQPHIITANTNRELLAANNKISWNDEFPFGFYTAKAVISYKNAPTVAKETSFLVLPLFPLLITVFVLFIILGVMWRVFLKLNMKEK